MSWLMDSLSPLDADERPEAERRYVEWTFRHKDLQTMRLALGLGIAMLPCMVAAYIVFGPGLWERYAGFEGLVAALCGVLYAAFVIPALKSRAAITPVRNLGMLSLVLVVNLGYLLLLYAAIPEHRFVLLACNLMSAVFTSFAVHRFRRVLGTMNLVLIIVALVFGLFAPHPDARWWLINCILLALCHMISWIIMSIHRQDFMKQIRDEISNAVAAEEAVRAAEAAQSDAFVAAHMKMLMHEINNTTFVLDVVAIYYKSKGQEVSNIRTSIAHMRGLVASFLANSAGTQQSPCVTVVRDFANYIESFLGDYVANHSADFVVNSSPSANLLTFNESPHAMATVVFNLVQNSIRAIATLTTGGYQATTTGDAVPLGEVAARETGRADVSLIASQGSVDPGSHGPESISSKRGRIVIDFSTATEAVGGIVAKASNIAKETSDHKEAKSVLDLIGLDDKIVISIGDNGPGISQEQADQIMATSYRGGTSKTKGGHGIGMMVVKNICEKNDFVLAITSCGKGTTVVSVSAKAIAATPAAPATPATTTS